MESDGQHFSMNPENPGGSAWMKHVRRVLTEGGHVRFEWRNCLTILVSADHKSFTTIDRGTYQRFLKTLAPELERAEIGSVEIKDLVIEWRKGEQG
jgi:hypothetical protein